MEIKEFLEHLFNTELSPEKMSDYTPNELADFLIKKKVVKTIPDVNRLVIEGLQKALKEDDEFPIHYYTKEEEMPEEAKVVDIGECLTDDFIATQLI